MPGFDELVSPLHGDKISGFTAEDVALFVRLSNDEINDLAQYFIETETGENRTIWDRITQSERISDPTYWDVVGKMMFISVQCLSINRQSLTKNLLNNDDVISAKRLLIMERECRISFFPRDPVIGEYLNVSFVQLKDRLDHLQLLGLLPQTSEELKLETGVANLRAELARLREALEKSEASRARRAYTIGFLKEQTVKMQRKITLLKHEMEEYENALSLNVSQYTNFFLVLTMHSVLLWRNFSP